MMSTKLTLSVEIELAWGTHRIGSFDHLSEDRSVEKYYLEKLLDACDRYSIPITFDIVGHLLESQCDGHDSPHRPGWFANDPETDAETDPLFYWPTVVDMIQSRDVDHEICTHTYSHVLCDKVTEDVLRWEFDQAASLHSQHGLSMSPSFVPPRHRTPSLAELGANGIEIVRVPGGSIPSNDPEKYGHRLVQWLLKRGHPDYRLRIQDGVVTSYTTAYPNLTAVHMPKGQTSPLFPFTTVPTFLRQQIHQNYLKNSVECCTFPHLWTHLYNISNEQQWKVIEWFLAFLDAQRSDDAFEILTMRELSDCFHTDQQLEA